MTAARHVLAHEVVRYVGEAVVAVVADSPEAAVNGAEAVMIDYEELPRVVDATMAMPPPWHWRSRAPRTECRSTLSTSGFADAIRNLLEKLRMGVRP